MFKHNVTKRKAFTLIELLIVIAIIGILFIVLISKVDFASDKAKATGVQTDFRSFQLAFETVSRENAGFNTFGWDTGDLNANGKRDSYDEGDVNKDNIQNNNEIWTGHKVPGETFTNVFTLIKPGTSNYDRTALSNLESAINANLDPKLHITIADDGTISMANGAQDPWNKEYHGYYITNAEVDKKDRGAIVMYSDGANNEFGSEHKIANGVVSISVPGDNKHGKDDYALAVVYTYTNGYGEVKTSTTGFSQNQGSGQTGNEGTFIPDIENPDNDPDVDDDTINQELGAPSDNYSGITLNVPYTYLDNNAVVTIESTIVFYEDCWTFFINGTHGVPDKDIVPMGKVEYFEKGIKLSYSYGVDDVVAFETILNVNNDGTLTYQSGEQFYFSNTLTKNSIPYFNVPTNLNITYQNSLGLVGEEDLVNYKSQTWTLPKDYNGTIVYYPHNRTVANNEYLIQDGRIIIDNQTIRSKWVDIPDQNQYKHFNLNFNEDIDNIGGMTTSAGHIIYDVVHETQSVIVPPEAFPGRISLDAYQGLYVIDLDKVVETLVGSIPEEELAWLNVNYTNYFIDVARNESYAVIPSTYGYIVENDMMTFVVGDYWSQFDTFIVHETGDSINLFDALVGFDDNNYKQYVSLNGTNLTMYYASLDNGEWNVYHSEQSSKKYATIVDGNDFDEYIPIMLNNVLYLDQEGCVLAENYTVLTDMPHITKNPDGTYHVNLLFSDAGWYPTQSSSGDNVGIFGDFTSYIFIPVLDFDQYMQALTNKDYDFHQMTGIAFIPAEFVN